MDYVNEYLSHIAAMVRSIFPHSCSENVVSEGLQKQWFQGIRTILI